MTNSESFLTVKEVAARLRICKMSVYRLIEEGALRAIKLKGLYRISQGDLQEFYEKAAERALGNDARDSKDD